MKFYKITLLLKYRKNKFNRRLYNRKIYSKLFNNNYKLRNLKKENAKKNHHYVESNLNPFSTHIKQSGYVTLSPKNSNIDPSYSSEYNHLIKNNPFNKKYLTSFEFYPRGKNILTNNNLYDYKNPNNITNYDDYYKNNLIHGFPNDYLYNVRTKKSGIFNKKLLNRTDDLFFTPNFFNKNRNRNIYPNRDDQINNQISKYLNDFNNNRKINLYKKNNNNYLNLSKDLYPKRRNKSNSNISKEHNYNALGKKSNFTNNYGVPYKTEFLSKKVENYFNKKSIKKDNDNNNSRISNDRLSFRKNKNNKNSNILNLKNNNKGNNKKISNDSKEYLYSLNNENKENIENNNINTNNSKKNSNISLNPSSLCGDHMKTFNTSKHLGTNNNLNKGNGFASYINSTSPRISDINYHFLNGLKMSSGEINEYFLDFLSNRKGKDKSDDQRSIQTLQSLSDSKMLELADHYINDDNNSVENYQMNNIIFNKKKHYIK